MTILRLFFLSLLIPLVLALVLFGLSIANDQYYSTLEQDISSRIATAYQLDITYTGNDEKLSKNILSHIDSTRCYRVRVLNPDGHIFEHRYYIALKIRLLDHIGDNDRTVKRIIKDELGKDRIIIYYDEAGRTVQKEFMDTNGKILRYLRNDFLPISGRTGY